MPLSSVLGAQSITKPGVCTSTTKPASPYDGQVIYMTDVDQTAVWDGSAWIVLAPIAGGRNVIINGGMDVWQRGTTFNSISNTAYSADRWWIVSDGVGTVNATQQAISSQGLGFTNCLRAERSSSTNRWVVGTNLETTAVNRLKGKTVTLSFYLRKGSGLSSNVSVALATKSTEAKFGTDVDSTAITVTNDSMNTSTFTRFSGTLVIPANTSALGLAIEFTANQAGASNAYFEVTGVQLEVGAVATPFEFEDYGTTLRKCYRYYWRKINYSVTSGTQSGYDNKVYFPLSSFNTVEMRATPTAAFESTPYIADYNSNLRTITAVSMNGPNQVAYTYDSTKLTTGLALSTNFSDAGRAQSFSAEL